MKISLFLKKLSIPLAIIFLIALFLRVINLASVPVGLHGDEASIGYNAYSLLKTGKDQDGHFLPLSFDQFGDFRAAGYGYLDIPFVALFGLNAFAVRLPAALFGSLTIIIFYFFLLELFENKSIALIGSFLLAILPWHINISRASSEGVISSFFVLL
ncbi:MAG: glycosyltransferase family 39 protein, partial [Candidatus Blackburnbacteria bacterium]|nr:glycosyltransferase family 39 protein [Candidatus Blackburnbacteria bacterium]